MEPRNNADATESPLGPPNDPGSGLSNATKPLGGTDLAETQEPFVGDPCDESKCVTKLEDWGLVDFVDWDSMDWDSIRLHFCYGNNAIPKYPMMCADGFVPKVVENQPPKNFTTNRWGEDDVRDLSYFTCCPPDTHSPGLATDTRPTRHCSDPIEVGRNQSISIICDDKETRKYPRKLKYRSDDDNEFFLCCDSNSTLDDANFLNDTECVPYQDVWDWSGYYEPGYAFNEIGLLYARECQLPDFPVPELDSTPPHRYQCCKSGTPQLYATDAAFKITVYTELTLYSIAATASALIVFGLSIPLLVALIKGNNERANPRRRNVTPAYSTYNLYLVYLAGPDLGYALYRVLFNIAVIMQTGAYLNTFDSVIPYMIINLWLNAIVCYQVLVLLKSSQAARRIEQPSLRRVNLQGFVVFVVVGLNQLGLYLALSYHWYDLHVFCNVVQILGFGLPIVYVLWVAILVWCRGYLPSLSSAATTPSQRAKRTLAIYFFRIVSVFLGVWIPGCILFFTFRFGFYLTPAIQAIVSTSVILIKPDVRKHVLDLLRLYNLFGNCTCIKKGNERKPNGTQVVTARDVRNTAESPERNQQQGISAEETEQGELLEVGQPLAVMANVMADSDSSSLSNPDGCNENFGDTDVY